MEPEVQEQVWAFIQLEDDAEKLRKLVEPYLSEEHPLALYAVARNSYEHESEDEFSKKYIVQITKASEGGIAPASYRMGVNHLYGDDVKQDHKLASAFFERAIEQGHTYTKFIYGFSLYYGTDENQIDQKRGLSLMQEAANEGEDKAVRELRKINGDSDNV